MANISYFYPDAKKGAALGLNAAGGNIGVSTVQLVVPAVVGLSVFGAARAVNLENIALVWVPLSLARGRRRVVLHGQPHVARSRRWPTSSRSRAARRRG